jgi:hypothetical protein
MGACVGKGNGEPSYEAVATTEGAQQEGKAAEVVEEDEVAMDNLALVFIKPEAANDKVKEKVLAHLKENHIAVVREGRLTGPEIDSKGIIDDHYAHIAKIALKTLPTELPVSDEKKQAFASQFGAGSWDELASEGKILNLAQFQKKSGKDALEVERLWREAAPLKLAPGTYVGTVEGDFVLNAFYGSMRHQYVGADVQVLYFVVRFPESKLCWKDFRGKVIGATNPAQAVKGSLRNIILTNYEDLGIKNEPNTGANGVHASAGPIEGLRERMVWLGADLETDPFGKAMLAAGVKRELLDSWLRNDRVTIAGDTDNAYDLLEDMDSSKVLKLAKTSKL